MRVRIRNFFRKLPVWLPFLRSLRVSIFALMMVLGIVPGIIVRGGILGSYEREAVSRLESDVSAQYRIIADNLLNYNYLQDTSSDVMNAKLAQMSNLYDGRVLVIGGNFHVIRDTYST